MKLTDILKEIKIEPATPFKVDPDKVLQMFLNQMVHWSPRENTPGFKLIGYKDYDRDDEKYLLYFFNFGNENQIVKIILKQDPATGVYEYYAEDFITSYDFENRKDITKINEIKVKPATPFKVDPDEVIEQLETLKHLLDPSLFRTYPNRPAELKIVGYEERERSEEYPLAIYYVSNSQRPDGIERLTYRKYRESTPYEFIKLTTIPRNQFDSDEGRIRIDEIKVKPAFDLVPPDEVLDMYFKDDSAWYSERIKDSSNLKLIGYKANLAQKRPDIFNNLIYFFAVTSPEIPGFEDSILRIVLMEYPEGSGIYQFDSDDKISLDAFNERTDITKLNEIKISAPLTPPIDPDEVLQYYINDLKDHLASNTDGSKKWRLKKRPQLFNPENYKLVNYTEHFDNPWIGGFRGDFIAYHFKYRFTGETVIIFLKKGKSPDFEKQVSDEYSYYYATDPNQFNKVTEVNEIKVKAGSFYKDNPYDVISSWLNKYRPADSPTNYKLIGYTEKPDRTISYYDNDPRNFARYFFLKLNTLDPNVARFPVVKIIDYVEDVEGSGQYRYYNVGLISLKNFNEEYSQFRLDEIKVKPAFQPKLDPDKVLQFYLDRFYITSKEEADAIKFIGYKEYTKDDLDYLHYYFKMLWYNTLRIFEVVLSQDPKTGNYKIVNMGSIYPSEFENSKDIIKIDEIKVKPASNYDALQTIMKDVLQNAVDNFNEFLEDNDPDEDDFVKIPNEPIIAFKIDSKEQTTEIYAETYRESYSDVIFTFIYETTDLGDIEQDPSNYVDVEWNAEVAAHKEIIWLKPQSDELNEIKVKPPTRFKVDPDEVLRQELLRKPMMEDEIKDYKLIGYQDDTESAHAQYYANDPRHYIRYYFQTPDPEIVKLIIFKEYPMGSDQYKYDSSWRLLTDDFNRDYSEYKINEIKVKPPTKFKVNPDEVLRQELFSNPKRRDEIKDYKLIGYQDQVDYTKDRYDPKQYIRYFFQTPDPETIRMIFFREDPTGSDQYVYDSSWPLAINDFKERFPLHKINEIKVKPAISIPSPEEVWGLYSEKVFLNYIPDEFLGYSIYDGLFVDSTQTITYYFRVSLPTTNPWLKVIQISFDSDTGDYSYWGENNHDINDPMWQDIIKTQLKK
jgi:hypothetical protein